MAEGWRLGRVELRDLLNKYDKAVEDDGFGLLRPSAAERRLLGEEVFKRRLDMVRSARDTNRRYVEAVVEDLPDLCAGPCDEPVARPLVAFRVLDESVLSLPMSSYGSLASVFIHLFRDWSEPCDHVQQSTYARAFAELAKHLPQGGDVLVPGAGLARLALSIANEGYHVEANEASRLFLTFADYILNRAPGEGAPMHPVAHVFSENFSHEQQYMQVRVPSPSPGSLARTDRRPLFSMVPGDFYKLYRPGGAAHRKFDAIVTCFFLDTATDVCDLIQVLDSMLGNGGLWINVGPLNWGKDARMKLNYDEVLAIWSGLGYEFLTQSRAECDYHMLRGLKMYTESYTCAVTTAIKRPKA